jgi:hypothetical protein
MRIFTIAELTPLSRTELLQLLQTTSALLSRLPDDAPERHAALTSLINLRTVLARRTLARPSLKAPQP